jgi:hypothetical protein
MKTSIESLSLDPHLVVFSFLNLSELRALQRTSRFFEKSIKFFLKHHLPHKNTQEMLDFLSFIPYLLNLKSDFPILTEEQPPDLPLPYLNKDALTPPTRSIFHEFRNFLSSYPIESEKYIDISPLRSSIEYLRWYTENVFTILSTNFTLSDPDSPQKLSTQLHNYKKLLSTLLETSNRGAYMDNINMRQKVFIFVLGVILKYSFNDLFFSKDSNCASTIRVLAFLGLIFKLLDLFFVSSCKNHLKNHYPGLYLSNRFLKHRLALFNRFLDNATTVPEINKTLLNKFSRAANIAKDIACNPLDNQAEKPLDLFFYYQHHHNPHTFPDKADAQIAQQDTVESIDTIYTYCSQQDSEARKAKRLCL